MAFVLGGRIAKRLHSQVALAAPFQLTSAWSFANKSALKAQLWSSQRAASIFMESENLKKLRDEWAKADFPVSKMATLLDHDNHEMRKKMREFLSRPETDMTPRYDIPLAEERELALKRLQAICDNKFISVLDFKSNPLRIFAAHELAAIIDPAMATKMTVQFNLFGGTVLKLGTERHHKALLEGIDSLKDIGCFGLTELGYGNNAVEMETTATYDKETQEFIVNTPSTLAQKYWITNGALHAQHIIVFAQLMIEGENHGIHGVGSLILLRLTVCLFRHRINYGFKISREKGKLNTCGIAKTIMRPAASHWPAVIPINAAQGVMTIAE